MPQYDGSIRINTEINTKDVPSQLMKLENSMQKVADKIALLRSKMDSLKDTRIPTQEYTEIQKQIEATEKKINDLVARQEKFIATGGKESSSTYQRMQYDLNELRNSLPYLQSELQDLVDAGKAFTLGSDTEQYSKLGQELQYAENNLAALNKRHDELIKKQGTVSDRFAKMKNSAKKAFDAVASGTKKSSGLLSTFASRLKGLAFSLLIFNWISKAFRAMISGMKEGFTNFMNYSDNFANSVQGMKNSMSTLGNQFAAAFAPIVQIIIPWLTKLINAISTAMTYVAQFIALLSGKSTFTRAKQIQDKYNQSLNGTAKAVDKARGALAKFDDLDVLEKQEDLSGGGDIGEALPKDMFEEIPIDNKLIGWLDDLLARLNELKDIFMEGFWDGLGDWEYRWESIKASAASIKDTLVDIWTDPEVISAQNEYYNSFAYMLGSVAGSAASIGLTIATNLVGGIALYLEQNKDRIKEYIRDMFDIGTEINNLISEFFKSVAFIFEAFASESGQQVTANIIGIFTNTFMEVTKLAGEFAADVIDIITRPFIDNKEDFRTAVEGFLNVFEEVTGGIKQSLDDIFDNINEVYDEHFAPFFDSIAEGLSELVGTFLDVWNNDVQPILDRLGSRISELLTEHVTPFINSVVEFVGNIVSALQKLWESILKPIIDWLIAYVFPILTDVIGLFVELVISVIEDILDELTGIMDFINNTLVPIWDEAWSGAEDVFNAFWEALNAIGQYIKDFFKGLFDVIRKMIDGDWKGAWESAKEMFSTFKKNVENVSDKIKNLFKVFFDWLSEKGVSGFWAGAWGKAGKFMDTFHDKVDAVVDAVRGILDAFFGWIQDMVASALAMIDSIKSAASGISGAIGGFFGGAVSEAASTASVASYSLGDVPQLATGAVLRGGNPFMAILNDQPAGHTNIEAPLATIEQAVENVMNRRGYNNMPSVGLNPTISLNVDGQEFARLTLGDILSEMNRQGYDVDVLGVT